MLHFVTCASIAILSHFVTELSKCHKMSQIFGQSNFVTESHHVTGNPFSEIVAIILTSTSLSSSRLLSSSSPLPKHLVNGTTFSWISLLTSFDTYFFDTYRQGETEVIRTVFWPLVHHVPPPQVKIPMQSNIFFIIYLSIFYFPDHSRISLLHKIGVPANF